MYNPITTYRLQFYKEFTFSAFEKVIPYLKSLGISTIYASPIFEAVPGSTHGYDGLNPNKINPEIGTVGELEQISSALKINNIGWLQDIVPNHMAYHSGNSWLMDVLEKGERSPYASFFDIDWNNDTYTGQIMAPFLGSTLEETIEKNELQLIYDSSVKKFIIKYYDAVYPVAPLSYATILQHCDKQATAIKQFANQIKQLSHIKEPDTYTILWNEYVQQLASFMQTTNTQAYIQACVDAVNNDNKLFKTILEQQNYRLCYWQETDSHINYRRFFTINGLICINIQDDAVFNKVHGLIKSLTDKRIFIGLRIDHIDGLFDPTKYVKQLRSLSGTDTYIVAEKILGVDEKLPDEWLMQGNTGYDFLAMVNNLFTKKDNEAVFDRFYNKLVNNDKTIAEQIGEKKAYILCNRMGGELENLYNLFINLKLANNTELNGIDKEELINAISEFLIVCPVYRYYGNTFPLKEEEQNQLIEIFDKIKEDKPNLTKATDLLQTVLLKHTEYEEATYNKNALYFYQRCMQFTGPLMAKGVEDTLMYTYNRFIGHNEVGDSPKSFGITVDKFHNEMIYRAKHWPYSLNATATHDTKRGEDVRARLNVLTDIAEEWTQQVSEWFSANAVLKINNMPDANDEYFIYQTLVGIYPTHELYKGNFEDRVKQYLQKALREAKTHTNWAQPNEEYESAAEAFTMALLNSKNPFLQKLETFVHGISDFGIINSLTQLLLKFTCPGIPDVYQGTELWDFNLVDPDNRRAVDYELRTQWLYELNQNKDNTAINNLWQQRTNGKIKLWLTYKLFHLRKQFPKLFSIGDYIPLTVQGALKDNILAFARQYGDEYCITIVPLHSILQCQQQQKDFFSLDWQDTIVILPQSIPNTLKNVFTDAVIINNGYINVQELFNELPIVILR